MPLLLIDQIKCLYFNYSLQIAVEQSMRRWSKILFYFVGHLSSNAINTEKIGFHRHSFVFSFAMKTCILPKAICMQLLLFVCDSCKNEDVTPQKGYSAFNIESDYCNMAPQISFLTITKQAIWSTIHFRKHLTKKQKPKYTGHGTKAKHFMCCQILKHKQYI